jgi:acetyltransferase-like isoleucine patch superfamily enzyme
MTIRIHPTAIVEDGVAIGDGTAIWDNVHVRGPCRIGRSCIVGEKSYIAYGVTIGDLVKINAFVYIPTGVTIGDGAMISAGTIFTNDRTPRATNPEVTALQESGPQHDTGRTVVGRGATIGAGCRIGSDLEIGEFAMVGMGSVVTRSVPAFHLVAGTPARTKGAVCRCGEVVVRGDLATPFTADCPACGRRYRGNRGVVRDLETVSQ